MSNSLASAKKRRAPIQSEPINSNQSPATNIYNSTSQPGLTLPQVIQIIDRRLTSLERFALEQKETTKQLQSSTEFQNNNEYVNENDETSPIPTNIKEVVEEFDKRYDMLAEEIVNLKNIVLSLQSYTMEVNKTLMEERGRIYDEMEKQAAPCENEN